MSNELNGLIHATITAHNAHNIGVMGSNVENISIKYIKKK